MWSRNQLCVSRVASSALHEITDMVMFSPQLSVTQEIAVFGFVITCDSILEFVMCVQISHLITHNNTVRENKTGSACHKGLLSTCSVVSQNSDVLLQVTGFHCFSDQVLCSITGVVGYSPRQCVPSVGVDEQSKFVSMGVQVGEHECGRGQRRLWYTMCDVCEKRMDGGRMG